MMFLFGAILYKSCVAEADGWLCQLFKATVCASYRFS